MDGLLEIASCGVFEPASVEPQDCKVTVALFCTRSVQTCLDRAVGISAYSSQSVQARSDCIDVVLECDKVLASKRHWDSSNLEATRLTNRSLIVAVLTSYICRSRLVCLKAQEIEIRLLEESNLSKQLDDQNRKEEFEQERRRTPKTILDREVARKELHEWLKQKLEEAGIKRASGTCSRLELSRFHCDINSERLRRRNTLRTMHRSKSVEYRPKLVMLNGQLLEIVNEERAELVSLLNELAREPGEDRAARKSILEKVHIIIEQRKEWECLDQLVLKELDLINRQKRSLSRTPGLRLRITNTALKIIERVFHDV